MVQRQARPRRYRFGVYRFDTVTGRLESPGNSVTLRPRAADLLLALLEAAPEPLSKGELIARVWPDAHIAATGVARLMNELRAALGEEPRAIETLPKRGYRWRLEISAGDVPPQAAEQAAPLIPAPRRTPLAHALVQASVVILVALTLGWLFFGPEFSSFPENPPVSGEEREQLARREFQAGYRAWGQWSSEQMDVALEHFRRAALVEPGLWFGFVGMADAQVGRILLSPEIPPLASKWAHQAAERAVELGPEIAAAECALGSVVLIGDWDWERAEIAFERALSLNAFSYAAYQRRGVLRMLQGRLPEARADFERSLELQPAHSDALVFLGYAEFCAGNYERALELLKKLPKGPGKRREALRVRAACYAMQRRFAKAREALDRCAVSEMDRLATEAWIEALAGNTVAAGRTLAQLKSHCRVRNLTWCDTAVAEAALARVDDAFTSLETGLRIRHWKMLTLAVDPRLAPLRGDPRWGGLISRIRSRRDAPGAIGEESLDARLR